MRTSCLVATLLAAGAQAQGWEDQRPCRTGLVGDWCDTSLSHDERVASLLDELTLQEKFGLMNGAIGTETRAVNRVGLPAYNWWNEALHGISTTCSAGTSGRCPTSYPGVINMAASFNEEHWRVMATQISDEARALRSVGARTVIGHGGGASYDQVGILGLTVWTPNINIFRDPRWGRGQETPGEDPLLNGRYAVAFVENLQGNHSKYVKLSANLKHFHSYSLEEFDGVDRHEFDAIVSEQDLSQTYLPHFEMGVKAGSTGMMCSYNRINGVPGCAANHFMQDLLRDDWGFDGYMTSDCYGLNDFFQGHQYSADAPEAVADAFNAGIDFECGLLSRNQANTAVNRGSLQEGTIDVSLGHQFRVLMRLGYFDPPEDQPYTNIPIDVVDSTAHREHALEMGRESIVLLKNDGILPLQSKSNVAIIGPNAMAEEELLSNYFGYLPEVTSPVEGLARSGVEYTYAQGSDISDVNTDGYEEAIRVAAAADTVIFVGGLNQELEGEFGDRPDFDLPAVQLELLKQITAVNPNVVLVLVNGGAVTLEWADANIPAIVEAFYPGEEGGQAIADVLYGEYNPSGRLPVTFYKDGFQDEHDFFNMDMRAGPGLTYRFFRGEPLYPFGHGLSYTDFDYDIRNRGGAGNQQISATGLATFEVTIKNTGRMAGDATVLAFVKYLDQEDPTGDCPLKQLFDFNKASLQVGGSTEMRFEVTPGQALCVNTDGDYVVHPGRYEVVIGDASVQFEVVGEEMTVLPRTAIFK